MNVPVLIAGYYHINKTVEFDGDVSIIGTYMHHGDNKYGGRARHGGLYVDNVTAIKVRSSQRVRPFSIQHLRVEG